MAVDTPQRGFLTVRQAAAELGVSRDWAYTHLPIVRLGEGERRGAVLRVRASDLEAFVADREQHDGGDAA
jgi:hypothetical protein